MPSSAAMARTYKVLLLSLLAGCAACFKWEGREINRMIHFGDSLSDTGRSYADAGVTGPPYYNGRWSNGPVWIDNVANATGIPFMNYAYGGAPVNPPPGPISSAPVRAILAALQPSLRALYLASAPTLLDQVADYQKSPDYSTSVKDPNALHSIWIGGNDYILSVGNLSPVDPKTYPIPVVGNMTAQIQKLIDAGAQNFMIINQFDLAINPITILLKSVGLNTSSFTEIIKVHNALMLDDFAKLKARNPQVKFAYGDILPVQYQLYDTKVFPERSAPCYTLVAQCSNPDDHMYWDPVHPSARAHRAIASWILQSVLGLPENDIFAAEWKGFFKPKVAAIAAVASPDPPQSPALSAAPANSLPASPATSKLNSTSALSGEAPQATASPSAGQLQVSDGSSAITVDGLKSAAWRGAGSVTRDFVAAGSAALLLIVAVAAP